MNKLKACVAAVAAASVPVVATAQSTGEGPLMVRGRVLSMVVDNANSPSIAGGPVEANNKVFPEVDFTWFIRPNIAAELILTYPQKHDISLGGSKIGSLKHLPPTLTAQYHFNPAGQVRPYVGAGINYTQFMSVSLPAGLDVEKSSFGPALQAGVDFKLQGRWYLNLDAKYVQIRTDVLSTGTKLTTLKLDPWLLSVGLGYRF